MHIEVLKHSRKLKKDIERSPIHMAKLRISANKKSGISKLRLILENLQKNLLRSKILSARNKQGHFAVIAKDDEEFKKFFVPLCYLMHPSFLRLLEQAAEEFGFDYTGVLTIPCHPRELEKILSEQ